jgi:ribosome biogenesis GTPase A
VARTSALSGYTKLIKEIGIHPRIKLLDTPGVAPDESKGFVDKALVGMLDFTHVKEPEEVVIRLMQRYPGKLRSIMVLRQAMILRSP